MAVLIDKVNKRIITLCYHLINDGVYRKMIGTILSNIYPLRHFSCITVHSMFLVIYNIDIKGRVEKLFIFIYTCT